MKANASVCMRSEELKVVSHFKCVSSISTSDCTLDAVIAHRVADANGAFAQLQPAKVIYQGFVFANP